MLYKLLQFPAHAPVGDKHPEFDADLPAALIRKGTGHRSEEIVVRSEWH
jgi:hypothetical protein